MIIAGAGLAVSLPDNAGFEALRDRPQEIASTLDGGAVISAWPKSIQGAQIDYRGWLTEEKYRDLLALDRHATQTEWTLSAPNGHSYAITLDLGSCPYRSKFGHQGRDINLKITVIRELYT